MFSSDNFENGDFKLSSTWELMLTAQLDRLSLSPRKLSEKIFLKENVKPEIY